MDQTNHHNSEEKAFWDGDRLPYLPYAAAPGSLLPTVLARLGLDHAYFSSETSIEELVIALSDPAWQRRAAAARMLAERSEGASMGPLLVALHDSVWQVRTTVIQALGALDQSVPIEPLLAALDDEDPSVRAAAVWAIGRLGEQAPLDRLLAALHDSEWLVREMAAMMLGTLGERVPAEPLLTALRDANPFVSRAAALALAQTHPEVLSALAQQAAVAPPATPKRRSATSRGPRLLHLAGAGLAALLLLSMFVAWSAFAQQLHPSSFHHPSRASAGAIIFTYRGDQGVEGFYPMWPSDSKYLALQSSFGYSVQVWDMATGNLTQNPLLPVPFTGFNTRSAWTWSPDGRYLAITSEDSSSRDAAVQVWDVLTGNNTLDFHSHATGLLYTAWSYDGTYIAFSSDDGTVQIWDPSAGRKLLTLAGHPGAGHRLFWSADDQFLLLSSSDGTFQLWNVLTGRNISTFRALISTFFELSPDGQRMVSIGDDGTTLQVRDTFTGRGLVTHQGPTGGVSFLEWLPDSRRILTANGSEVQIWDAITGQTILDFAKPASSGAWQSFEGRHIFTANASEVQIWNVSTGHTILEFPNPASSGTWQLSPDGQYFAFASWDNSIQVWNTITGHKVSTYRGHTAPLQVLAWSSDNWHIASASGDGTLQVWDAITGRSILTYHGFPHVISLTWSPDSRLIAATSEDNTVQVLQAA